MHLSESLLWCFYPDCDLSGIQIFCDDSLKETIKDCFEKIFWEKYQKEVNEIKKNYIEDIDDCIDDEFGEISEPIREISITDYGIFIAIGNLSIFDTWSTGDNCHKGMCDALDETLSTLFSMYKDITIKGYIGYCWSDSHGGEVEELEISYPPNDDNIIYDFVGEKLNALLKDEEFYEEFGDTFFEEIENDKDELLDAITNYRQWIDDDTLQLLIEKIEDSDVDEEIQKEFIEYLEKIME